jgi:hypothetical protein
MGYRTCKESVYSSRSSLYRGLFENGFRRAEKGAECEYDRTKRAQYDQAMRQVATRQGLHER